MSLSTHVLDTARGRPATGVSVVCDVLDGDAWRTIGTGVTDDDGRIGDLVAAGQLERGTHRLTFHTGEWAGRADIPMFWPHVVVTFTVADGQHHHVPLLLSPFGYATYRGS